MNELAADILGILFLIWFLLVVPLLIKYPADYKSAIIIVYLFLALLIMFKK